MFRHNMSIVEGTVNIVSLVVVLERNNLMWILDSSSWTYLPTLHDVVGHSFPPEHMDRVKGAFN